MTADFHLLNQFFNLRGHMPGAPLPLPKRDPFALPDKATSMMSTVTTGEAIAPSQQWPFETMKPGTSISDEIKTITESKKVHAYEFLDEGRAQMKDRAAQRDVPGGGERSMGRTVSAFNAMTGHNLTEAEGWEFMILLKLVRGRQGAFRKDDYVDAAAYSGLLGECESTSR